MRTLLATLIASVYILLLMLTIEVAGINRSLRRLEREERRSMTSLHDVRPFPRLVSWYLMRATTPMAPVIFATRDQIIHLHKNTDAPLSQWKVVKTLSTEKECRAQAGNTWAESQYGVPGSIVVAAPALFSKLTDLCCVAADDPRQKGN